MHRQTHKNKPAKKFGSFDSFKFDGCERKNNAVNHQKTAYGKGFGVSEVIRTPDLSLRRRSLYPAELRKRMAAEPPRLFSKFCLALREKTLAVHDKALVRALSDKTGLIRCFNPEGQTATVDFGQRSRTGDVHADRGR